MKSRRTTMSTKGQVVIPKPLRKRQDLHVGTTLSVEVGDGEMRFSQRSGWARATAGCLSWPPTPQMSPEEMDEAAERSAIEEARGRWGVGT